MQRNPKLAHEITNEPEVMSKRHTAIDKITSAHLVVDLLARATAKDISATDELRLEDRLDDVINEAVYAWNKYRYFKKMRYEDKLHATMDKGNEEIVAHSDALNKLREQRGI